ncbi:MAG: efflux transporter outer membrane subunit [Verrucomicrobia bacterium]|nr:efflux transporter outer membrane subunit [Verrucomicrobiota bacterium]
MSSRPFSDRLLSCVVLLVLGGCAPVGPDHEVPGMELPATFSQGGVRWKRQTAASQPEPRAWWRLYQDGVLTSLVERALAHNQDLAASAARLRQARAMSEVARSLYFPDINLGTTVNRAKTRFLGATSSAVLESNFIVPVDFSYEVDVWGKVRRQVESAGASAAAAGETLHALRLSVAGEVAQTYWALRAVDADRVVLTRTVAIRRKALELLTKRRDAGSISGLDLARAETEVATAEAGRIRLDQDRVGLVNALAVLTGSTATGFTVAEQVALPIPPSVPVSVPSELLRQRPDIRAAERRVAAANADIGVVTAAFYPSFAINANGGLSAARLADLLQASSLVWSLGTKATVPITRGKRIKAQQRAAQAAHEAVSAEYRQTVLESIREVENALQGAAILVRRQAVQDQALAAARKTFDLSTKRFTSGLVSFLDVVDAERTRLQAEQAANAIRAERLAVSVSLIKALGGEW